MECKKITYKSLKEAEKVAKHLKLVNRNNVKSKKDFNVNSYQCPFCGLWHHTSMKRKEYKTLIRKLNENTTD